MTAEPTPLSDKELWKSLTTAAGPVAPVAVSDMDFAAWLEGRLTEEAAAPIEAAVASDPALRQSALELAEILGRPLPTAPPQMVRRAQALAGDTAPRQSAPRSWLAGLFPDFGLAFGFRRGALAGMAAVVAVVGFVMGGGLGESYAERRYASVQTPATVQLPNQPLGRDTLNDLNDLFSGNT